jgi:sialate O-acetylesterase
LSFENQEFSMRRLKWAIVVCLVTIGLSGQQTRGDVKLPALFSNGMVLQSGSRTPIWGTADPGEGVSVILDMKNDAAPRSQMARANSQGHWEVILGEELSPRPRPLIRRGRRLEPGGGLVPGGPFTLTVSGKNRIAIQDIYVGEVWIMQRAIEHGMAIAPNDRSRRSHQAIEESADPLVHSGQDNGRPTA